MRLRSGKTYSDSPSRESKIRTFIKKPQSPQDAATDILPSKPWPSPVAEIVAGYAWTPLEKPSLFSGADSTLEKILHLAATSAGPLKRFQYLLEKFIENELRQGHAKAGYNVLIDKIFTLDDRQGTLMQCLAIGLDFTLRKEDGTVIEMGMVDCFAKIVERLLPHRYPDLLQQIRIASPLEDTETKNQRESANINKLKKIVNVFVRKDKEHIREAIETLKDFVEELKRASINEQGYQINNMYQKNIIHLIWTASALLYQGRWEFAVFGYEADRICIEIIGGVLQSRLSRRVWQTLLCKGGLAGLFYNDVNEKKDTRAIDPEARFYLDIRGSTQKLGVDFCYNVHGNPDVGGMAGMEWMGGPPTHRTESAMYGYENLLRAITAASEHYTASSRKSHASHRSCNVEIDSGPAAKRQRV